MAPNYCTQADQVFPVNVEEGPYTGLPAKTIWQVLEETRKKAGNRLAYQACNKKEGDGYMTSGSNQKWTFNQTYEEARKFGRALLKCDCPEYASVNIIGFNSFEWVCADLGAMMASTLAAGVYTTNTPDACHYQAEHSDAHTVVCEGLKQLEKYKAIMDEQMNGGLPKLKVLVVYNVSPEDLNPVKGDYEKHGVQVYEWKEFLALDADNSQDEALDKRMEAQQPGSCIKLIYTSGTTGRPKAVMISHDNMTWTAKVFVEHMSGVRFGQERVVSFLPLSHIAAQQLDIGLPISVGASVHFARPDALKGSLKDTLTSVKPTIFFGVPRVWEKFAAAIKAKGAANKGLKLKIAKWAKGVGAKYNESRRGFNSKGKPNYNRASKPWGFAIANAIVFKKVRAALGLEHCHLAFTGAAPISKETLEFFSALNIPVMELFGQSECTGPGTSNTPKVGWEMGSCGPTMPGTKLRIDPTTHEIQYTGRHIFMGYLKNEEKTKGTFCDDGWLASGDQGEVDDHGFMRITGRIKELIIGAGGENIAPVLIEKEMKKEMEFLSNCIVFGERKPYLGMLISLPVVMDPETQAPSDDLDPLAINNLKAIGVNATKYSEAQKSEELNKAVEEGMKRANERAISKAQTPRFHIWLPEDLNIPNDTLGPTLKMKRGNVYKLYADEIEAAYEANKK